MRVLFIVGTRPEAIKLAPLIRAMRARRGAFHVRLCLTAQHRDLLGDVLRHFALRPDVDLDVMTPGQSLTGLTAALFGGLEPLMRRERPDWVVVQGDTTSAMVAAVAGVQGGSRVLHVEAGLRTGRLDDPVPEELNRTIIARVATLHCAPTEHARANLLREGIADSKIAVTGNTGIDALQWTLSRLRVRPTRAPRRGQVRTILVTLHRRESFGAPLAGVCRAVADIAGHAEGRIRVLWPVHPNPRVSGPVRDALGPVGNVHLLAPVPYADAIAMLRDCDFVMTDSGGLQEEAPALGKPVLVLREVTERPEGVAAGVAEVVGRRPGRIVAAAMRLIQDKSAYARMARVVRPYGDGRAAERIVRLLSEHAKGDA